MNPMTQILKTLSPDVIVELIQSNQELFIGLLQKTKTFNIVGGNLTESQQILISTHALRINDFLASERGQNVIIHVAKEFESFIEE